MYGGTLRRTIRVEYYHRLDITRDPYTVPDTIHEIDVIGLTNKGKFPLCLRVTLMY